MQGVRIIGPVVIGQRDRYAPRQSYSYREVEWLDENYTPVCQRGAEMRQESLRDRYLV